MADWCATYTFAGITINGDEDTDTLVLEGPDSVQGLDGAPVRRQVDPLANQDGGESQPAHFGHRIITFKGALHMGTHGSPGKHDPYVDTAGYMAKVNALVASVVAALEGTLNSASALAWTPQGGSAESIQCMYGIPGGEFKVTGSFQDPKFEFTLIAEDPDI